MRFLLLFLTLLLQFNLSGYNLHNPLKDCAEKTLTSENTCLNEGSYKFFRYYDPSTGNYISQEGEEKNGVVEHYVDNITNTNFKMKHYKNLSELIKDKDNYPNTGRVYIQKLKINDLKNAEYWVISSKEAKEQDYIEDERGSRTPVSLIEFNVKSFLDIQTFQDIIDLKLENNPELSIEQTDVFVEAIDYYLENDDFLD